MYIILRSSMFHVRLFTLTGPIIAWQAIRVQYSGGTIFLEFVVGETNHEIFTPELVLY